MDGPFCKIYYSHFIIEVMYHYFYFFRISIGYKRKNTFLKRPPIIPFWSASIPASKQPHDYFSLLNLCAVVILCTYSSHVFTNFLFTIIFSRKKSSFHFIINFYSLSPFRTNQNKQNYLPYFLIIGPSL